ncbi:nucleotide-diphospho-sugar transferase [Heminiphilus faecis]|uniref:Nucleotide-diphospho-sugar transferase n=1 Tax=Heminiphilus faecis TaxID=2601703 RepID=A0ABV4CRT9_9BACT
MTSPVLFLIFNRPDTTERVFEEIRKAQPPRLYIAADGPRANRTGEKELCEKTRAIAQKVDWNCEVKTLFRDENLGCGRAVSQAITWFFDNEPEGIILEDDILPHPDFFPYCDELLDRYRDNDSIGIIAGHNHMYTDLNRTTTYGFQNLPAIWGWATWRRTWNKYDFDLNFPKTLLTKRLEQIYPKQEYRNFWYIIYDKMRKKQIDTWDFQLVLSLFVNKYINIIPYFNLTKNIGFGENSTHTNMDKNNEATIQLTAVLPLIHPDAFYLDEEAERYVISKANWEISTLKCLFHKAKYFLIYNLKRLK